MYAIRHTLTLVTDASGDAEAFIEVPHGRIHSIRYIKPGSDAFADGVDFAITSEATGLPVWSEDDVNASKTVHPVAAANLGTGAASTITEVPVVLAADRLKIAVSSGGDTKSGTFHVIIS